MSLLSTVVWYNNPNKCKNHTSNPFITYIRKNGKLSFQPWDSNILNFYLFTNEFRIKFEYSVYSFLFSIFVLGHYRTAKFCQIHAVCFPLQSKVSMHACTKPFPIDNPCTMDVNARHVNGSRNGYIWETVAYMHIMWFLYRTELGLHCLHIRWPVME